MEQAWTSVPSSFKVLQDMHLGGRFWYYKQQQLQFWWIFKS
jgi:hypothetical protein